MNKDINSYAEKIKDQQQCCCGDTVKTKSWHKQSTFKCTQKRLIYNQKTGRR